MGRSIHLKICCAPLHLSNFLFLLVSLHDENVKPCFVSTLQKKFVSSLQVFLSIMDVYSGRQLNSFCKCYFCQSTVKIQSVPHPPWNDTNSDVLFSLKSTAFRSRNASVLCTEIVRPQNEQANAKTTAWARWLNTERCFLISERKAFWSRLKAAKPLQVKTSRTTLKRC